MFIQFFIWAKSEQKAKVIKKIEEVKQKIQKMKEKRKEKAKVLQKELKKIQGTKSEDGSKAKELQEEAKEQLKELKKEKVRLSSNPPIISNQIARRLQRVTRKIKFVQKLFQVFWDLKWLLTIQFFGKSKSMFDATKYTSNLARKKLLTFCNWI